MRKLGWFLRGAEPTLSKGHDLHLSYGISCYDKYILLLRGVRVWPVREYCLRYKKVAWVGMVLTLCEPLPITRSESF